MDQQLKTAVVLELSEAAASGGMPPVAALAMPKQNLKYSVPHAHQWHVQASVMFARLVLSVITVGITAYGVYQMLNAVKFAEMTFLQGLMIAFFAVTLNWIAFAAGTAVIGLLKWREPEAPADLSTQGVVTALVMPIYNEDAIVVAAALQAMAESLAQANTQEAFEIVILSDSTSADAWIRESIALSRLRANVPDMPIWYRRRWQNIARKSGNVEDFVEKWGARYDYMIVLDADSLIDGATLTGLVRKMHADPALGILQTAPSLINATTVFGRMQQFASRLYGPVVTRGLAAWSGDSGNYWGHNAIIRVAAFAQCCGLPQLPGRKPFGGFVLSHDFVEAALIRRAGYKVRLATDLTGSYEECPPTLTDVAVRDRRWVQGNLQHSKVIGASGLSWASRLHLCVGIMSYVSSPLWLVLLCVGFALSLQSHLIRPEYFTKDFQLFPTWPRFDARLMMNLFEFSMLVLLTPKLIGFLRAIVNNPIRRATYGILGLVVSCALELVLSALYAPILMLTQSTHVFEVLLGRDSGWSAQRRRAGDSGWAEAWRSYRQFAVIGIVTAVIAWFLSPSLLAWLSPALAGLILAVPLALVSGNLNVGQLLAKVGLLRTPEELRAPSVVARKQALVEQFEPAPEDGLRYLASHRDARLFHIRNNLARPDDPRGKPDPNALTAEQKIDDAAELDELLDWLSPSERVQVAGSAVMLHKLSALPELPRRPPI